jgi:hypothetical protein
VFCTDFVLEINGRNVSATVEESMWFLGLRDK